MEVTHRIRNFDSNTETPIATATVREGRSQSGGS